MMSASNPNTGLSQTTDPQVCRIAVLLEFEDTWGRNLVESIARFAKQHNWQLTLAPRDTEGRLRVPRDWQGDGVIVCLRDTTLMQHVRDMGVPAVDVSNMFPDENWLGRVTTNDVGRAEMAFQHFRARQLQHFACYAPQVGRYPHERAGLFRDLARDKGFSCSDFADHPESADQASNEVVTQWLASLPRPVGIFASDPFPARQLMECCTSGGIDVPGEVAIISGDEDELLCGTLSPPITSIELASHRIGFEAATMLHQMMRDKKVPEQPLMLDPLRVCPRRSTEHWGVDDPELSSAVRLIWDRAAQGIQVNDVVQASAMSRRRLEQRFREVLGCSPAEEIRRVKVERARQMVVTTSLSISAIAMHCGFSTGPYLAHAFRKQYGINPSELRLGR